MIRFNGGDVPQPTGIHEEEVRHGSVNETAKGALNHRDRGYRLRAHLSWRNPTVDDHRLLAAFMRQDVLYYQNDNSHLAEDRDLNMFGLVLWDEGEYMDGGSLRREITCSLFEVTAYGLLLTESEDNLITEDGQLLLE